MVITEPGPLSTLRGSLLLGQAGSFALKVRSLLLPGVQDPSNQCLLH
jgi:hypothetical protein